MPLVEVFCADEAKPLLTEQFDFLPRAGEYLSRESEGYFVYLHVVEVWHRETAGGYQACIRVEQND